MLQDFPLEMAATPVRYWYLRNHRLFEKLDEQAVSDLCIIAGFRRARRNEDIPLSGVGEGRIFLLKRGMVKLIRPEPDGSEVTVDVLQQGDIFGQLGVEPTAQGAEIARAVSEEVIVCSFLVKDFEHVLATHPAVAIGFSRQVGKRLYEMQMRYHDLVFQDVHTRLRTFLRNYVTRYGAQQENGLWQAKNVLTHQDIADLIGATRQTVSTALATMKRSEGLVFTRSEICWKPTDI